jgi:signal transduction histidine kinase
MRSFSTLRQAPKRFSLQTLLKAPINEVVSEVASRCNFQYDHLKAFPETRPISILKSLYKDTIDKLEVFQGIAPLDKKETLDRLLKVQFESLDARHGMITETLGDAFISLKPQDSSSNVQLFQKSLPQMLHRQATISVLLQHGIGMTSSSEMAIIESDLMTLCTGSKNESTTLTEHEFNWSPEVVITITDTTENKEIAKNSAVCVPSFVRFVVLELLKNSLYATAYKYIKTHPTALKQLYSPELDQTEVIHEMMDDCPSVKVDINCNSEYVEIVVTDEGSGMSQEQIERAADFMWASTIKPR